MTPVYRRLPLAVLQLAHSRVRLGIAILGVGIGAVQFTKKFIPEEVSIQDRHDGPSSEVERKATAATLVNAFESSTIKRRKLIWTSAGIGLGAFGLGSAIAFIGGLIHSADALAAIALPAVEVHISNVLAREDYRKTSYISGKCEGSISGLGLLGYELAVLYFLSNQGATPVENL